MEIVFVFWTGTLLLRDRLSLSVHCKTVWVQEDSCYMDPICACVAPDPVALCMCLHSWSGNLVYIEKGDTCTGAYTTIRCCLPLLLFFCRGRDGIYRAPSLPSQPPLRAFRPPALIKILLGNRARANTRALSIQEQVRNLFYYNQKLAGCHFIFFGLAVPSRFLTLTLSPTTIATLIVTHTLKLHLGNRRATHIVGCALR